MSASLKFSGLGELIADMRNMPAYMRGEAGQIGARKADEARTTIRSEYKEGPTGNLRKGVVVSRFDVGAFGIGVEVRSTAPHAWLYEYGSAARRSRFGSRGRMPARPVVGRTMSRKRREFYRDVADMMREAGLTKVTVNV